MENQYYLTKFLVGSGYVTRTKTIQFKRVQQMKNEKSHKRTRPFRTLFLLQPKLR